MATIQVNGIELYYEVSGDGEPLLLLHGLGSSTRDWELQTPVFAEHFQAITVDMRGHGRSAKPPGPYSVPLFAQDTAMVLQELGVTAVRVVGISMGGMIAFQLALDFPQLIKKMVIVNSMPELVPRTLKEKFQIWQRYAITRIMGMRRMGEFLSQRLFPKPEQAEFRERFAERWAQNDQRAYLTATKALAGWSVTERLGEIGCPTLVIAADEDYWPVAAKEAYTAQIPDGRLVIFEDSRHVTPIDQTQRFNQTVLHFLQEKK